MKRLRSRITVAASVLLAIACSDGTGPTLPIVDDVLLSVVPDTIGVGDTLRLIATPHDSADAALTNVRVTWRSLAPVIATIDSAGLLTARNSGDAPIVVTAHGRTAVEDTIIARVRWVPRRIVFAIARDSVIAGDSLVIATELRDSRDQVVGGRVSWTSSDSLVVQVDSLGVARARNVGDAWVRAAVGGWVVDSVRPRGVFARRFAGLTATAITLGTQSTAADCVLDAAGAAWCEGIIPGDGTENAGSSPGVPRAVAGGHTFRDIGAGQTNDCGLATDGTLYCWGYDSYGSFGLGSTQLGKSLVPVVGGGGLRFLDVNVGDHGAACGIAAADSVVYCWGHNDYGQVGRLPASQRDTIVAPVAGSLKAVQVDLGAFHGCAVTADRALWCWGSTDAFGSYVATNARAEPSRVAPAGSFIQVETGFGLTCALAPDGIAWCWGASIETSDAAGYATTPRAVQQGATRFASIVSGFDAAISCGLTASGELWCWTTQGRVEEMVAHRIMPGRTVRAVSIGSPSACAVTTEGETYCWPSTR